MAQVLEEQRVGTRARWSLAVGLVCAVVSAACVMIPMFVIRPFRPQEATALNVALRVRQAGPWVSGLCAVLLVVVTLWSWKMVAPKIRRVWFRVAMVGLCVVAIAGAYLTHVNIFEKMFHPYDAPAFGSAAAVAVDPDDKVLAVWLGGYARAYPIR